MNKKEIKESLFTKMMETLEGKIEDSRQAVDSARQSRDSDTKSTAGDKHETGRAMMQRELENYEVQLGKAVSLKNQLSRVDLREEKSKVEFGSLVFTSQSNYFISVGMGKVDVENVSFYAISITSPIGQALKNKISGEKIMFQGREFLIEDIV